jgi:hypothetical protein
MGFEPMNTGFADQRVSHFAIGARAAARLLGQVSGGAIHVVDLPYRGCAVVRR